MTCYVDSVSGWPHCSADSYYINIVAMARRPGNNSSLPLLHRVHQGGGTRT
uniref:Uncharacterized protein n=1 Tax=Tetraselmis sp. GSL018 TaxID=582737 RepID=A0A061SNB7_9CHLO